MNALRIVRQYASLKNIVQKCNIDFFADRLSHTHSVLLVLVCISFTTIRYFKSTIDCWIPKELKRYESYMTKLCWLKGTYYLPIDQLGNVIDDKLYDENAEFKKEALIPYYQWIVIILLLQALMFYIPYILWSFIANRSGYELSNMMNATAKYEKYDYSQERVIQYLSSYFKRNNYHFNFSKYKLQYLALCRNSAKGLIPFDTLFNGISITDDKKMFRKILNSFKIYLHFSYLLVKLLYLCNTVLQLFLINYFLTNAAYKFNAFDLFKQMLSGVNMQETAIFPIIVQCDLNIAHDLNAKGESHFYSIRCVLSLNMLVEKIYVFLWIWCFVVTLFTFIDFCKWTMKFIFMKENYNFIKFRLRTNQLLMAEGESKKNEKYLLKLFVYEYLSRDGVFILNLMEKNAGILVTNDVIVNLWNEFKQHMTSFIEKTNV